MYYDKNKSAEEYQAIVDKLQAEYDDPETPQGKLRDIDMKLSNARHNLKIAKREEFEHNNKISVYGSDDYIGCSAGQYSFYYGYEVTKCPVKSHKTDDDCYEKDCDQREWCFTVDKDDKEIIRWAESEFSYCEADDIERTLIVGMAKFIKEHLSYEN